MRLNDTHRRAAYDAAEVWEPEPYVCSACGRTVPEGESMWTVNIHEEVLQGDEITVLDPTTYLVYCRDCQGDFDFPKVSVPRIRPED